MNAVGYGGDAKFKKAFLAEVEKHRLADQIVAGTYGEFHAGVWKGCAVGCSLRSLVVMGRLPASEWGDHRALADSLGIPLALVRLEDRLFEGMSQERRPAWPGRFADAIAPGADLSGVWTRLARWLLTDSEFGVIRHARREDTKAAIRRVEELYGRRQEGDEPSRVEWADAAADAAYAAAAAADAAAAAADAYAYAAYAAAAAYAARRAYYDAMADAARRAYYDAMADKLIQLMQECKP